MKKKWSNGRPPAARLFCIALFALCLSLAGTAMAADTGAPGGLSPTTGLPTDKPYRPILANISNSQEARPPWGLEDADIVYEAVIWGPSHTRYLALFNDTHPEVAGSLRGIRVYQAEIRQAWDCPFAFHGGQSSPGTDIYEYFDQHQVPLSFRYDGIRYGSYTKAMSRIKERVSPHNAVANIALLAAEEWPEDENGNPYEPRLPSLVFSQTPSTGDMEALSVTIDYEDELYRPMYTFSEAKRAYERWYDGEGQYSYDGSQRIVASNVIVQYCPLSYFDDAASRPVMETLGEGAIDAFIDGRHIRGTWRRSDANAHTEYLDEQGNPLKLLPGKTFIQIMPLDMGGTYEDAQGNTHSFSAAG